MFRDIIRHPLNIWHMQFKLNNQTQGFGIITNLTSRENRYLNTYCAYNNFYVDNPMIVFEDNRLFDFLKYNNGIKLNNTFNQSLGEYQNELYKRILEPNRNYIHLELYDNSPFKHKFLHSLQ